MELEQIKLQTTWNDAAGAINSNNLKIDTEVTKLQGATYKNKGYFKTLSELQEAHPNATVGCKAYVGLTYPYTIYLWQNGAWTDSGTGGDESISMEQFYTKEETDTKLAELETEIYGQATHTEQQTDIEVKADVAVSVYTKHDVLLEPNKEYDFILKDIDSTLPVAITLFFYDDTDNTVSFSLNGDAMDTRRSIFPNVTYKLSFSDIAKKFSLYTSSTNKPTKDGTLNVIFIEEVGEKEGLLGRVEKLEDDVTTINEDFGKLWKEISPEVEITPVPKKVLSGKYITSDGSFVELVTISAEIYSVKKGDVFTITQSNGVGSAYLWALYNASTVDEVGASTMTKKGNTLKNSDGNNVVEVDIDGFIGVSKYSEATYEIKQKTSMSIVEEIKEIEEEIKEIEEEIKGHAKLFRYYIDGESIEIAYHSKDRDIVAKLAKRGGNNIFDFNTWNSIPKDADIATATKTSILGVSTDWHAPFIVEALQNADGDDWNESKQQFNGTFTGGNHQYNNASSGSTPTGRTTEIRFFVDGIETTDGSGSASVIKIAWKNRVQGFNTKLAAGGGREILEESHEMTFADGKFVDDICIIALEDIAITGWYGIQWSGLGNVFKRLKYVGGANRTKLDATASDFSSGSGLGAKCTQIIGEGDLLTIKSEIDGNIDLGNFSAYSEEWDKSHSGGKGTAKSTGTKTYFKPIWSNFVLHANECCYLRGSWEVTL